MSDILGPIDENEPKEKWDGERWLCEGCDWLKYNPTEKIRDCRHCVFTAGRLAGLKEARGAVANIRLLFDSDTPGNVDLTLPEFQWVRNKALAAIDWLMESGK